MLTSLAPSLLWQNFVALKRKWVLPVCDWQAMRLIRWLKRMVSQCRQRGSFKIKHQRRTKRGIKQLYLYPVWNVDTTGGKANWASCTTWKNSKVVGILSSSAMWVVGQQCKYLNVVNLACENSFFLYEQPYNKASVIFFSPSSEESSYLQMLTLLMS